MKTIRITLGLALPLLLVAAPAARAQQPPSKAPFSGEVTVSEVLLDVLVTDRDGNVIVGLEPDDFVVEENGQPVDVASVTFYSNRNLLEPAASLPGKVDTARQNRYFILFLEEQQRANADNPDLRLMQRQLEAAREARRWVKDEMLLDDWVAVVSYDVKLKVHQDFTRNKADLERAINDATRGADPGANWPSRIPEGEGPSLRAFLPQGQQLRKDTTRIYDAFRVLADAAGHVTGRKNVIFLSTGFGDVGGFGLYKPDPRFYPPMVQALNDNNVAVYTIDMMPEEVVDHTFSSALHQLADETGGTYYENFANFITPLKRVASENSGYYLLSYRSTHPAGSAGYQKVVVDTKNREFKVRAREGYLYGQAAPQQG
jgi:VWFA-related protein